MATSSILYAIEFNNYLAGKKYDAVIIRGDRFEMLGLAMVAVFKGFKVIHIEGGDLSGVIDNKVRHSITHLSDLHFCTNEESHRRLINMGVPLERVWDFGSLDVEYASKVKPKKPKEKSFILVAYHPINSEDEKELERALSHFKGKKIIKIGSNSDYGRTYGAEQYSPEDYINLMRYAKVCVGNSSSLLKEASILGVSVVLVGDRQDKRLQPKNVLHVPCQSEEILQGILFKMQTKSKPDFSYFQPDTSKKIVETLEKVL